MIVYKAGILLFSYKWIISEHVWHKNAIMVNSKDQFLDDNKDMLV